MAGPGATLRVDGFRGGKLPPKSQIRSIRFSRDMYAAENHAAGMVFVDIVTQPGLGPLRGSMDFLFRDDALNARNAYVTEKGPEQTQQYTFNLSGTLRKERTSFSLSATGASLYDSANINALHSGWRRSGARSAGRRTGSTSTAASTTRSTTLAHAAVEPAVERQRTGQPRRRRLRPSRPRLRADDRRHACCGSRRAVRGHATSSARIGCSSAARRIVVATRTSRRGPSACSTPSPPAARSRLAAARSPTSSGRPTSTWTKGTACDPLRQPRRGRLVRERQPHELSRHLHVHEPGRLRSGQTLELHAAHRQSARRLHRTGRPGSTSRTTGGRART